MFQHPLINQPYAVDGDSILVRLLIEGYNQGNKPKEVWFGLYVMPGFPYQFVLRRSCRLKYIDAPERRPRYSRRAADLVRQVAQIWLDEWKPDQVIAKSPCSFSHRFIGDLLQGDHSLSQYLLEKKLVKRYQRRRKRWTEKELKDVELRCLDLLNRHE